VESAVVRLVGRLDTGGSRVPVGNRREALALSEELKALAAKNPEKFEIVDEKDEPGSLRLTLRVGSEVYPVELRWALEVSPPPAGVPGNRVAFVIDDLGRDVAEARAFLDLELPVTPAVIPHLAHSLDVAHLARERGREFLLHMPMEPQGYPKIDPGRGALLQNMSEAEVRLALDEALSSMPGAAGVNNHMGSRLTELRQPMGWVMEELKSQTLFFLDSSTSGKSIAADVARSAGLGWAKRDVFLDNEQSVEAVERQIELVLRKAEKSGSAIAIGHPYRTTLEALRIWAPKLREAGVQAVPLSQLIHRPTG
jgi:polysaccharide deacetylase 2 family uncharacterized protein YibQ